MCRCSNECNRCSSECNRCNRCSGNNFNGASINNNINYRYGSAYVPNQVLGQVYTPMQGLSNGTMFPELVSSYYPGEALEVMNYLRFNCRGGWM